MRLFVSTVSPRTVPRNGSIASVVVPPRMSTVEWSATCAAAACPIRRFSSANATSRSGPQRLDVVVRVRRAAVDALDEAALLQLVEVAAHGRRAHAEQPSPSRSPSRCRRRGCSSAARAGASGRAAGSVAGDTVHLIQQRSPLGEPGQVLDDEVEGLRMVLRGEPGDVRRDERARFATTTGVGRQRLVVEDVERDAADAPVAQLARAARPRRRCRRARC